MDKKIDSNPPVSEMIGESGYDREKELEAFDNTKAGVKGLVDKEITTIPRFFVIPQEYRDISDGSVDLSQFEVPMIDLEHVQHDSVRRERVVEEIRHACETWGFFQVTNHGIPQSSMDEMIEGVRRFNEQPHEERSKFYSRDLEKKVRFNCNFDLFKSKAANWRDTLTCVMAPNGPLDEEYPSACRDITLEYSEEVKKLGKTIFELISQALGLHQDYLENEDCARGHVFYCQYYPKCPEPNKTLGHARHTDPDFLTVLLQDRNDGLQVLHQNHWINVHPKRGSLVINIGDLLQLMSNDRFKSAEHRVLAESTGPRISAACFFTTHMEETNKLYGPIKELISDNCPALYQKTTVRDYIKSFAEIGLGSEVSALSKLRLIRK